MFADFVGQQSKGWWSTKKKNDVQQGVHARVLVSHKDRCSIEKENSISLSAVRCSGVTTTVFWQMLDSGDLSSVVEFRGLKRLKHTLAARDDTSYLSLSLALDLSIFGDVKPSQATVVKKWLQWLVINSSKWHISISAHFHDRSRYDLRLFQEVRRHEAVV